MTTAVHVKKEHKMAAAISGLQKSKLNPARWQNSLVFVKVLIQNGNGSKYSASTTTMLQSKTDAKNENLPWNIILVWARLPRIVAATASARDAATKGLSTNNI